VLNAALFSAQSSSAHPASGGPASGQMRATSSSELWVQVTLCVIVTILLLAVISFPKLSASEWEEPAYRSAHELHAALQKLRGAVGDYRFEHGAWPGMEIATASTSRATDARLSLFEEQLTSYSDIDGATSAQSNPNCPLGPYLDGHLPVNPIDGLSSVRVLNDAEEWPANPDDSTGWIYRPSTGEVRANCSGNVPASPLRYYDL
jgi:hypothetical protein